MIHYYFQGKPHAINVLPHGNSKTGLPFHPTEKSVLIKMSEELEKGTQPGKVYTKVSELIGASACIINTSLLLLLVHKLALLGFKAM